MVKYNKKPYIIAEIGSNHNGSLALAKKTILSAKKSGADCVKFQSFTPESLFSKDLLNKNKNLKQDVYKYYLTKKKLKEIANFCKKTKIDFASTPFNEDELNFLVKKLKVKFIKIASMDLNNLPFLKKLANLNIPIVISTGMGSFLEIKKAIKIFKLHKSKITILHCVSMYPAKKEILNLNKILLLKKKFKCDVGYSDHSIGPYACLTSIMLGANIIEKHFTLNKNMKGWDHSISADEEELRFIVQGSKNIPIILGKKTFKVVETKKQIKNFRRSIVAKRSLNIGHTVTDKDLNYKRPGDGIPPNLYKKIIGKKLKRNLKFDQQFKLRDF